MLRLIEGILSPRISNEMSIHIANAHDIISIEIVFVLLFGSDTGQRFTQIGFAMALFPAFSENDFDEWR